MSTISQHLWHTPELNSLNFRPVINMNEIGWIRVWCSFGDNCFDFTNTEYGYVAYFQWNATLSMKRDLLFSTILIYFCCQCVYFQLDLHTILRIKYENIYLWLVLRSIAMVKINIERLLFDLFIGCMNKIKASNQWFSRYLFCSVVLCCVLLWCVVLCCVVRESARCVCAYERMALKCDIPISV